MEVRPGSADLTLKLKDVRPGMLPPIFDGCRPAMMPQGEDQEHDSLTSNRPPKPAHLAVKVGVSANCRRRRQTTFHKRQGISFTSEGHSCVPLTVSPVCTHAQQLHTASCRDTNSNKRCCQRVPVPPTWTVHVAGGE